MIIFISVLFLIIFFSFGIGVGWVVNVVFGGVFGVFGVVVGGCGLCGVLDNIVIDGMCVVVEVCCRMEEV